MSVSLHGLIGWTRCAGTVGVILIYQNNGSLIYYDARSGCYCYSFCFVITKIIQFVSKNVNRLYKKQYMPIVQFATCLETQRDGIFQCCYWARFNFLGRLKEVFNRASHPDDHNWGHYLGIFSLSVVTVTHHKMKSICRCTILQWVAMTLLHSRELRKKHQ